jgi:hypothetical protein
MCPGVPVVVNETSNGRGDGLFGEDVGEESLKRFSQDEGDGNSKKKKKIVKNV